MRADNTIQFSFVVSAHSYFHTGILKAFVSEEKSSIASVIGRSPCCNTAAKGKLERSDNCGGERMLHGLKVP